MEPCRWLNCPKPGTEKVTVFTDVFWYCEDHVMPASVDLVSELPFLQ